MTPKDIHKMFMPQKIFIFLKTPKNIEIQKFDPKKMDRAYVCMKISEYPPGAQWYNVPYFTKVQNEPRSLLPVLCEHMF